MIKDSYSEFLCEKIFNLFGEKEGTVFMEESEKPRPLIIRCNTLKTSRKSLIKSLSSRGIEAEILEWNDDSLIIYKSGVPIGATPEYLAGFYFIMGASSIYAVMNLDIQDNMSILDMCASPGGKSCYIGSLMKNTGILYCNDVNEERINSLCCNLQRMGIRNAVVTNVDARIIKRECSKKEIKKMTKKDISGEGKRKNNDKNNKKTVITVNSLEIGLMDRILLDAPCSGTGTISRDKQVKCLNEVTSYSEVQKELILSAVDRLKSGGILVYSTCSVLTEENECVVEYLLKKRKVEIMDCELNIGKYGFTNFRGYHFHKDMKKCRRFYPHVHNMDGFFVAKIKKI
ncbi:25S rRNA (cytosine-C(5))-methyltransferase nop2 [Dictyocoela muelleri]|nr:25S rRNA (cytosine-C(5))-methyltransferase nop2 [Dictyocoela muelleri]